MNNSPDPDDSEVTEKVPLATLVKAFAEKWLPEMNRRLTEPLDEGQWSWVKYPGLYATKQELENLLEAAIDADELDDVGLKRCPFCGAWPASGSTDREDGGYDINFVGCMECDCEGFSDDSMAGEDGISVDDPKASWNRRA